MKYDIRFITETTRFNRTTVKKEQMSNKTKATARKLVKQFTAKFPKYTRTNPQYECVWVPHLGCYLNTKSIITYTYTHKFLWKTTVYTMVVIKTVDVPEPPKETSKETSKEISKETPEAATPAASTPKDSYHIVIKEHTRDNGKVHHKTVYDKHVTNKLRNKLINGFIDKYKNEYKSIKRNGSITYTTNAKDKEAWVTLTLKEIKKIGYKVYKELTDNEGNVVHKTPSMRTGNFATACAHARVWSNGVMPMGVYEVYSDGTEKRICAY